MRYLFVLLAGFTLFSFSCKDEACPIGYEGSNCETAISPKSIIIKNIKVNRWASSVAWDSFSDPDPYVVIYDSNLNELGRTNTIDNTTNSPLIYSDVNIVISFPGDNKFFIRVIDEDDITDDLIMGSYFWFPGSTAISQDFPNTVNLDESTSDTAFSLIVEYNF